MNPFENMQSKRIKCYDKEFERALQKNANKDCGVDAIKLATARAMWVTRGIIAQEYFKAVNNPKEKECLITAASLVPMTSFNVSETSLVYLFEKNYIDVELFAFIARMSLFYRDNDCATVAVMLFMKAVYDSDGELALSEKNG